jgi:hypothetical protein
VAGIAAGLAGHEDEVAQPHAGRIRADGSGRFPLVTGCA